jgi:hypothetical protein
MDNIENLSIDQRRTEKINQRDFKTTPPLPDSSEDPNDPETGIDQIKNQVDLIRSWASEHGLIDGKDFKVIESIRDIVGKNGSVAPHELKQFFVIIHEDKYSKFRDYFTSDYRDKMKSLDPKNDARLLYSWGGRFLVGWAGVPFDTVAASSIENLTIPTHHEEFKKYFREKTGFDFPAAKGLNSQLREMAKKSLPTYQKALANLREMEQSESLETSEDYGLPDAMVHAIEILEQAKTGNAVEELPEILQGNMPRTMRSYADLTYNAATTIDLDRVAVLTGVYFPQDSRVDRIFEPLGLDRSRMKEICKDFADYRMQKGKIEKAPSK